MSRVDIETLEDSIIGKPMADAAVSVFSALPALLAEIRASREVIAAARTYRNRLVWLEPSPSPIGDDLSDALRAYDATGTEAGR